MPHPSRSTEPARNPGMDTRLTPAPGHQQDVGGAHSALSSGPSAQDADSGLQMGTDGSSVRHMVPRMTEAEGESQEVLKSRPRRLNKGKQRHWAPRPGLPREGRALIQASAFTPGSKMKVPRGRAPGQQSAPWNRNKKCTNRWGFLLSSQACRSWLSQA